MELALATSLELLFAAFFSSLLISVIVIVGSRYMAGSRSSSSSPPTNRRFVGTDLMLLFAAGTIFVPIRRFVVVFGVDLEVVFGVVDILVPEGLDEVGLAIDFGVVDFVVVSILGLIDATGL